MELRTLCLIRELATLFPDWATPRGTCLPPRAVNTTWPVRSLRMMTSSSTRFVGDLAESCTVRVGEGRLGMLRVLSRKADPC